MTNTQPIGLVLGGGAARGFAHIGAIKAIHERQLKPDAIAASSMGGIFGALLANGMAPGDMLELASSPLRFRIPPLGRRGGLVGIRSMIDSYCECLPEKFEDLEIPLCVTAVDVEKGLPVVIDSGPLREALEATTALPGLCSPVRRDGCYLVDGGLLNNLPVNLIRALSPSPVVAVDVSIPRERQLPFAEEKNWWKRMLTRLSNRALTAELLTRAIEIPQAELTATALQNNAPNLRIKVEFPDGFRLEHFHRAEEGFECGYRSAIEALQSHFGSP